MLFYCLTKCIAWRDFSFIWVNIERFEVSFLLQFCVIIEIRKMTDRNKIVRFVDVLLNSQVTACINSVCSNIYQTTNCKNDLLILSNDFLKIHL